MIERIIKKFPTKPKSTGNRHRTLIPGTLSLNDGNHSHGQQPPCGGRPVTVVAGEH